MLRTVCFLLLAGLGVVAFPSNPALADAGNEQALRQLEFARQELDAGRHDRAIKSARSALRFDPTQLEAIVIKALSFEALSDFDTAEDLLAAYLDFSVGRGQDPRVAEALERIASNEKRKKAGARQKAAPPTIDDHQASTKALIGLGRCDEALGPALDFATASPTEPRAFAILGDVRRCGGRVRQAGFDYRTAVTLGGRDPAMRATLKELEAGLATIVLDLEGPASQTQGLDMVVMLGTLAVRPSLIRGDAHFDLMPTGTPFSVQLSGRGFPSQTVEVAALAAGEVHTVAVAPGFLGLGTVTVADWPAGGIDRVEIMDGEVETMVYPGQTLTLVAGTTSARIANALGTIEVPVEIVRNQETRFEPGRSMPAALSVGGVPTGSTVEVKLGESEEWVAVQVAAGGGVLNQTTGMLIAPPVPINGVLAGPTALRVNHPSLGVGAQAITLAPAVSNEVLFDSSVLPGSVALTKRWKAHKAKASRRPLSVPALGALIGGGVAFALGGVFAGAAADSQRKERPKYDIYFDAVGTGVDTDPLYDDWIGQTRTTATGRAMAGVFVGIGVVGVGVSIPLGLLLKPKAKAGDTGPPWEPEGF